jgi:hypothetical protein
VANLIVVDFLTGVRDELSAGRFVHLQHRRDLRVGLVEYLMQEISPNGLWLTALVGLNLLQSAFTNWCPGMMILRGIGLKDASCD